MLKKKIGVVTNSLSLYNDIILINNNKRTP